MNYLVTRHPGALQWLKRRFNLTVTHLTHLPDNITLCAEDCVMGTLPVNQVAKLSLSGVRYFHLCVDIPQALRGKELSEEELDTLGASLQEFYVKRLLSDEAVLVMADQWADAQ